MPSFGFSMPGPCTDPGVKGGGGQAQVHGEGLWPSPGDQDARGWHSLGVTAFSTQGLLGGQSRVSGAVCGSRDLRLCQEDVASEGEPVASSNPAILGGHSALSRPIPAADGGGPEEALQLPQVEASNLKHIFSIKYLISLKVINIYHVL